MDTKARVIPDTRTPTVQSQIKANVVPGATLCTDEHAAYRGMSNYTHLTVNHSAKEYVNGMAHTNGLESVWALLKRGYYGTFHHFTTKHLQRYVDEFAFRLNEGNCSVRSMDRVNALFNKGIGVRLTYRGLTGK